MNSSLKLGAYTRRKRFQLVIKDRQFWKAMTYSLLSSLTFSTTIIALVLELYTLLNGIQGKFSFYIMPFVLLVIFAAALFPLGTFLEFLCAESEHSTIAEFCAESIKLDLKIIRKLNPWYVIFVLPYQLIVFVVSKFKRKLTCLA